MNTEALGWFLIGVGSLRLLQVIDAVCRKWRQEHATPREPNPEPGPRVTPASLKTGGLEGLIEERANILEAMRLVRRELKALRQEQVVLGGTDMETKPTELHYALAEYQDYNERLAAVDIDIEVWEK